MSPQHRPSKTLFLVIAFASAILLPGCAHEEEKPWHRKEKKWYQGDMESDDRAFFIDSFFNGR